MGGVLLWLWVLGWAVDFSGHVGVAVNLIDLFLILPVFLDFCPCIAEVFSWLPGVVFGVIEACPLYPVV